MNILFIAILILMIVATLSFLMPWASKKIEEPFASQCLNPSVAVPIVLPSSGPSASLADSIELGKQKYNLFGFLQSQSDRRVFDTGTSPSAVGSIDTSLIPGAPAPSNTLLKKLNANIRSALETVNILPNMARGSTAPHIDTVSKESIDVPNLPAFMSDATTKGRITQPTVGYVEERLPPRDSALIDAAKCEVNNMHYFLKSGLADDNPTSFAEARGYPINRADFCNELKNDNAASILRNIFSTEPTKICGVCIKDAKPISQANVYNPGGKGYNGIGGMFIRQADINATTSGTSYRPTYGTCAEGYFFIPDAPGSTTQYDACSKAAQRLNCEEIQATGGFNGGRSLDGISGEKCFACIDGRTVKYAYSDIPTTASIRVRVAVPTGTGLTILRVIKTTQTGSGSTTYGPFRIRASKTANAENKLLTTLSSDTILNNAFYFTIDANPDDVLKFQVAQEFPHRPRGVPEVFYVGFPTGMMADLSNAEILASSIDCDLATLEQLTVAQQLGLHLCDIGIAADGKKYTVRSGTISSNPMKTDACNIDVSGGGVKEQVGAKATGIWVYGIKPEANALSEANVPERMEKPVVANWKTYYSLTTETGVSKQDKDPQYFQNAETEPRPNYRGICIQLEKNDPASLNAYENVNVGIEDFLTKVGNTVLTNNISERLQSYSRNGRFADSERIVRPRSAKKSATVFALFNSNQYWLWSPVADKSPTFILEAKVPGYFKSPTHVEDNPKCRNSVLYSSQAYVNRVIGSACDNGLDEEDRSGCLAALFREVGGDLTEGTMSPATSLANRRALLYKDFDPRNPTAIVRNRRTVEEIRTFLLGIKDIATGRSETLRGKSEGERISDMNAASMKLSGKQAIGPCERITEDTTGTLVRVGKDAETMDAKCLDSLYRNTIPNSSAAVSDLQAITYPNIGNRHSGLTWPGEYTTATTAEKEAFPYKACQPKGTWAPIKNGQEDATAVAAIKSEMSTAKYNGLSAIQKAMKVFEDLHTTANSNSVTDMQAQQEAIERCYGISKKSFLTNCNGLSAKYIFIYTFDGLLFGGNIIVKSKDAVIPTTKINGALKPAPETRPLQLYTFGSPTNTALLPTSYTKIATIPIGKTMDSFFIKRASLIGAAIDAPFVDYIINQGNNTYLLVDPTSDPRFIKMVSVSFQISTTNLEAKINAARYHTITNDSVFMLDSIKDYWIKGTIFNIASSSTTPDAYGVRMIECGFYESKYDATEETSGITYRDKALLCANTPGDGRIFKGTDQTLRSVNPPGCPRTAECCIAAKHYFMMTNVSPITSITITKPAGTEPQPPYIVLLKDLSGYVVAQKVVSFSTTDTTKTVEFLEEDVRPYIPYNEIRINSTTGLPAKGDTNLRIESAVGKNFFLLSDGILKVITDTSSQAEKSKTGFQLAVRSANIQITDSPIYKLRTVSNIGNFLVRNSDNSVVATMDATKTERDWVIKPAINGSYAFVSIELANIPGHYLVAQRNNNGTFKAATRVIDPNSDVDKFLASWRMYPAI